MINKKQGIFAFMLLQLFTIIVSISSVLFVPDSFWIIYITIWKFLFSLFLMFCLLALVVFIIGCCCTIWDKLGDVKTE